MTRVLAVIAAVAAAASATSQRSLLRTWSAASDSQARKVSPTQRVVALLRDMEAELQKALEADQAAKDKMDCWCDTNQAEKTKAITDADAATDRLSAEIQERAARGATLAAERQQTKKELASAQEALSQAEGLRDKEQGENRNEESDLVQAVAQIENAVKILKRVHGGDSFLQVSSAVKESLRTVLASAARHRAAGRLAFAVAGKRWQEAAAAPALLQESSETSASARMLHRFVAESLRAAPGALPVEYAQRVLLQEAASAPANGSQYNSNSSQIFGVLGSMLDEFKSNLEHLRGDEANGGESYSQLKAAKSAQIAAAEKLLAAKSAEHARNGKDLADAKEDLTATREQRAADDKFLQNVDLQCSETDHDFALRMETRHEEIAAVGEAVGILVEDDNREHLSKSVSFAQIASGAAIAKRRAGSVLARAVKDLQVDDLLAAWNSAKSATSTPSTRLAQVQVSLKLDSFGKVKAAIDKMSADIKKQVEDDVDHKSYCTAELNSNAQSRQKKNRSIEEAQLANEGFEADAVRLTEEIAAADGERAETVVAIKQASEEREAANAVFQATVTDQRAAQQILATVVARLEKFYGERTALVQQEPPASFKGYKKSQASNSVLSLLDKIVSDSKAVESEAISEEKSAQSEYELFVASANAAIKSLKKSINMRSEQRSNAESDKQASQADHQTAIDELAALQATGQALHNECDFLLKNFSIRAKAMAQEIEALRQVKAILSGSGEDL